MKIPKFEYIDVANYANLAAIEVRNLQSLIRLTELSNIRIIFKKLEEAAAVKAKKGAAVPVADDMFFFPQASLLYWLDAKRYQSLEDYADALEKGFPEATDYYEAKKGGYFSYKEYEDCVKLGHVDRNTYLRAQKLGYLEGYDKLVNKIKEGNKLQAIRELLEKYNLPVKLYEYAVTQNFRDYSECERVLSAGFTSLILYKEATSKGFVEAADYFEALEMGFQDNLEYTNARFMSIRSKTEYDQYKAVKNANFRNYAFDQFQLVEVLKELPNGKKLPLKKLFEGLHTVQEAYKFGTDEQQNKVLPQWYTRQLNEEASLIDFISKTPEVRNIGIYDAEGEYFEVFKVSHEKVYIDASNVAFNSNHRDKNAKPQLSNIKLIAEELIAKQFRDISVIADASLRHQVGDANMLEALKHMTNYMEAPSRSTADEFLLQFARKEKCMIISNDTFKDWKVKDPWVAENIDKLRVTFIINEGSVMFSGLDKFANR